MLALGMPNAFQVGMTKHDKVISALMVVLNTIETATMSDNPHALALIRGLASQAQINANAHRTRNTDGYLVMKS
jgi:hypothetical protein